MRKGGRKTIFSWARASPSTSTVPPVGVKGGGGVWPKPQSLILIKDIKEGPRSLSVWSTLKPPRDIKIPGCHLLPRCETGGWHACWGDWEVFERSTESLCSVIGCCWTIGGKKKICRGSKVAAVGPEQQHRELKELFYYYYYSITVQEVFFWHSKVMKSVEIKSQSGEFHKKKYRAPVTGWGGGCGCQSLVVILFLVQCVQSWR